MKKWLIALLAMVLCCQNSFAQRKEWTFVSFGAARNIVSDFYLKDVDGDDVEENLHMKFKGGPISDIAFGKSLKSGLMLSLQHGFGRVKFNAKKSETKEEVFVDTKKNHLDLNSVFANVAYSLRTRGARPFIGAGYGMSYNKLRFATASTANTDYAKSEKTVSVNASQVFGGFLSALDRNFFLEFKFARRFWDPKFNIIYGADGKKSLDIKVKTHSDLIGMSLGYRF